MIYITPKIIAPNYISYVFRKLKSGSSFERKQKIKMFLFLSLISLVPLKFGKFRHLFQNNIELIIGALIFSTGFILLLYIIFILAGFFIIWPSVYKYSELQVQKKTIFKTELISYSYLEKILLDSRYSANLYFRTPDSFSYKTSAWFGTSKESFYEFVNFLSENGAREGFKIGIIYPKGFEMKEHIMSSHQEAYKFLENHFTELKFD